MTYQLQVTLISNFFVIIPAIGFFMSAGQVSDYTGAAALLGAYRRRDGCWPIEATMPNGSEKR